MIKDHPKDNATMGRPKRNNADYFPHFTKTGRTKRVLRKVLGHTGTSCWWELLEILTAANNHFVDVREEINWIDLLDALDIDEQTAIRFFDLLVKLGKIDAELWESKVIWCQSLVDKLAASLYYKRSSEAPQKPDLSTFRAKTPPFRAETPPQDDFPREKPPKAKQSKAEESEVKKSRGTPVSANGNGAIQESAILPFEDTFSNLLYLLGEYETSTKKGARKGQMVTAQRITERYPESLTTRKINHFTWVMNHRPELAKSNPAGYLVKSIEESYPPPAGYEEWLEQELKKQRIHEQAIKSLYEDDPNRCKE